MTETTSPGERRGEEPERRTVTVSSCAGENLRLPVPFIRIRGRYLERAGFRERTRVAVTVTPGRIILEPMPARGGRGPAAGGVPLLVRMLEARIAAEGRSRGDCGARPGGEETEA